MFNISSISMVSHI